MRLHRFYIDPKIAQLKHRFWLRDSRVIPQWLKVLRYKVGQEVILFDGVAHERLYKITRVSDGAVDLEQVTDFERKLPKKDIYLAFAMLKNDKNDWVLQKCTEQGVNHFLPLLSERCEKTGFNENRAQKIVIEASEQCGRSNIPSLREPISPETLFDEFSGKVPVVICEQKGQNEMPEGQELIIVVGPEGGWTDNELKLFENQKAHIVTIGDFTHRAETASIAAISKLL